MPLVLGGSCKVDFLRKVMLGEGAGRETAVVAVAELKNSHFSPLNGVPQALVAAFSAVVDLRAKGLPVAQCVVPFLSSNGLLEQHGAAYLLEPSLPCAAMTTSVLDLSDLEGQRRAEAARWAFRRMADRTTALLQALLGERAGSSAGASSGAFAGASADASSAAAAAFPGAANATTSDVATAATPAVKTALAPELDTSRYHIKLPLQFVGRNVEQSVLQQLRVFERLRRSPASRCVVLPAAVLMQDPTPAIEAAAAYASVAAAAAAAFAAGPAAAGAGATRAPRATPTPAWRRELAVAFPMLVGFSAGVPVPGDPLRSAVLAALRSALRRVHRAGVVHLDLFPGNILWARNDGAGGSGAAAADPTAVCASGAVVALRLVDFDAALEVGQRVPACARDIVERNGHRGSYHPRLFDTGARAEADLDWWHFCLLADENCPFAREAAALPAWLSLEGARERLLARVAAEVAAEDKAAEEVAAPAAVALAAST